MTTDPTAARGRAYVDRYAHLMNKVPEITVYFWLIKVLCTTVGQTFADYLDRTLGLGLTLTTIVIGAAFLVALTLQLRARHYVPWIYWLTVALVSVFGTLITDNLTAGYGVPTSVTTPVFAVLLAITFAAWWKAERTLSIHTIRTPRREAFYWVGVLFTFALGTAGGDLLSEQMGLGHLATVTVFAAAIAVVAVAHYGLRLGAVVSFWLAYVLTRPLGASIGDYVSQARHAGGLGLGTATSVIFLGTILSLVVFLTVTRSDVTADDEYDTESFLAEAEAEAHTCHH
ncbi:hypothetical protein [Nocardioides cynanchi]|uniref:COG4705 family protein n=1 Tax=Nocardioides cynanchi TaxID=2558918 RepID=UPI00124594FA|nr:hypothetical protein [Nocardioides cynanchi]